MIVLVLVTERSVYGASALDVQHIFASRKVAEPEPARCLLCGRAYNDYSMTVIGRTASVEGLTRACAPEMRVVLEVMAS